MLGAGAGAAAVIQAAELGVGASLLAVASAKRAVALARGLMSSAPTQLPRLARIELMEKPTPMSLGLLLDEQARKSPTDTCFLFADRAHRQADVKSHVDSIVKGLISVGILQGDRVGVQMSTRPTCNHRRRCAQPPGERLPDSHHTDYIQAVPSIALTAWHPVSIELQRAGIPKPSRTRSDRRKRCGCEALSIGLSMPVIVPDSADRIASKSPLKRSD